MIDPLAGPFEDVVSPADARQNTSTLLPLAEYDRILVQFSGGKDSAATVLEMLRRMTEQGVPRSRLELWHQLVDGSPEDDRFMDWPVTHAYCIAVARALDLPIRFMWREGGFKREMLREDAPTADVAFELDGGRKVLPTTRSKPDTRKMFPQVSPDLRLRWCSAYLKIDVAARVLANDPRFQGPCKVLVVTGERREESGARACYAEIEEHRTSNQKRRVDHLRPVLGWPEDRIWATLRYAGLVPHPCYFAGFGRASCAHCIFQGPAERATMRRLDPYGFVALAGWEMAFRKTVHRQRSMAEQADLGELLLKVEDLDALSDLLLGTEYLSPVLVPPSEWKLPAGAFRHGGGPT